MIAGIDVGLKGAIGLLYPDGTAFVYDMPVFGKEVNVAALADVFREFQPNHVYIEFVNSFGMGRQSAFNFGQGVGSIKGTLGVLGVPWSPISSTKWKKRFNLGRDKDESRAVATRLFPKLASQFTRKKDDGRAEALLIAKFGSEQ